MSTKLQPSLQSSTSTLGTPLVVRVKIEPGVHNVIDLTESSNDDAPRQPNPGFKHSPSSKHPAFETLSLSRNPPLISFPPSPSKPIISIVQCLCRLFSMPTSKNILKKLDHDTLQMEEVNFLPPRFDGNRICSSSHLLAFHPLI